MGDMGMKTNFNSTTMLACNAFWNSVTKWGRLALDEIPHYLLFSFKTIKKIQGQLVNKFDSFIEREQRLETGDVRQLYCGRIQ